MQHAPRSYPAEYKKVIRAAGHESIPAPRPPAAGRGLPPADETAACAASCAYLLEELAAITLQGAAESSPRIYPGPELASFKALRQGLVPGAPPDCNAVILKIKWRCFLNA
jgi:hypothetical protein